MERKSRSDSERRSYARFFRTMVEEDARRDLGSALRRSMRREGRGLASDIEAVDSLMLTAASAASGARNFT